MLQAGSNCAHLAAIAGNLDILKLFVERSGEDCLCAVDGKGRTPLHVAAIFGHAKLVTYLIAKKHDMGIRDQEGCTPLHMVVKSLMCDQVSQYKMAKIMVEAGADPAAVDNVSAVNMPPEQPNSHRQLYSHSAYVQQQSNKHALGMSCFSANCVRHLSRLTVPGNKHEYLLLAG